MKKLSNSSLISASKDVIYCEVEEEIVILNIEDEVYYGLNPVGAFIWNLIQEPRTVAEINELISNEYDVEEEVCRYDLMELLQKLLDKKLIEID